MAQHDATLFKSPMAGEHCLHGFTNRDIRSRLTGTHWLRACADDPKKPSTKVGRCFRRLHAHGFIAKIPRTRRWRVTDYGARSWVRRCTCASTTSRTSTPRSCTELLRREQGSHSKRIYAQPGDVNATPQAAVESAGDDISVPNLDLGEGNNHEWARGEHEIAKMGPSAREDIGAFRHVKDM